MEYKGDGYKWLTSFKDRVQTDKIAKHKGYNLRKYANYSVSE